METCEWCNREIVDTIPENVAPAKCGGYNCGHVQVYLLEKQDCRQVILRKNENNNM